MLAEAAGIQHTEHDFDIASRRFQRDDFKTGAVEENFLGIGEATAAEIQLRFDTALNTTGIDNPQRG